MITYKQGDVIEAFEKGEFEVLIHQTNCVTKDRVSGIANSIFNKYPEVLEAHLKDCRFNSCSYKRIGENLIVNCNSQYYPGICSDKVFIHKGWQLPDNFHNRLTALINVLKMLTDTFAYQCSVGIPLIGSGLGADTTKKGTMSDLEYFKQYIAPEIEHILPNLTVYYL